MKRLLGLIFVLLTALPLKAAEGQERREIVVHFPRAAAAIDSTYLGNSSVLQALTNELGALSADSAITITQITIDSYTSPEGELRLNQKLAARRSEAMLQYLCSECSMSEDLIQIHNRGIAWDMLSEMVLASATPYKSEVVDIINTIPEETWRRARPTDRWQTLVDSRIKHLMELRYGRPYRYMEENIFPYMRQSSVVTIYFRAKPKPIAEPEPEIVIELPAIAEPPLPIAPERESRSPLRFALKTNLLYDLAMMPNIELEIPFKSRWSIAGEWICPWWVSKNNGYALQLLSGQVEARYWFGSRDGRAQLTGLFAAIYAGGGLYDLQWNSNGYQGEFFVASGISAGYAHTINKSGSLRMEYSLGFGYLKTNYRYYEGKDDNEFLVWQHNGNYSWLGPTKAKISLAWFINLKRGGRNE
ncbi:MAG: DUF3575 domain-containing protein [Rikenellaceae bacterium]